MEALDEAVRLGFSDLLGSVFDLLDLQEELVGVLVGLAVSGNLRRKPLTWPPLRLRRMAMGFLALPNVVEPPGPESVLRILPSHPGSGRRESFGCGEIQGAGSARHPRHASDWSGG